MHILWLLVLVSFTAVAEVEAAYTLKNGKIVNKNDIATMSVQEHYSAAMEAYQNKQWEELLHQSTIVIKNFPTTPFAYDALYYNGVAYFQLQDYELANKQLSAYLKKQATPKYFEEAIQYKFAIAEKFKGGARKHIMGWKAMPQWIPAREEAIEIYDAVITALPHHDLGAQALYGKAKLLLREDEYAASIETFQTLIRRFPKHKLAPESYLDIARVYMAQCRSQYPDPDFLDLAEINLRNFREDFPGEDKVMLAEKIFCEMREIYAGTLYETGQFFERTKKPHASVIYYAKAVATYPDTQVATQAKERLKVLKAKVKNMPQLDKALEQEAVVQESMLPEASIVPQSPQDPQKPRQEYNRPRPDIFPEPPQAPPKPQPGEEVISPAEYNRPTPDILPPTAPPPKPQPQPQPQAEILSTPGLVEPESEAVVVDVE